MSTENKRVSESDTAKEEKNTSLMISSLAPIAVAPPK